MTNSGNALKRPMAVGRRRQTGTALVMALVFLLVLTILGLSAMRTSSLEQLMAGNVQESLRAFAAAESASTAAIASLEAFNSVTAPTTVSYDHTGEADSLRSSAIIYPGIPLQIHKCPRGNPAGGQNQNCAFLDQIVVGSTTGIQNVRHQGVRQPVPSGSTVFDSTGPN